MFADALLLSHTLQRKAICCRGKSEKDMKSNKVIAKKEGIIVETVAVAKETKTEEENAATLLVAAEEKKAEEDYVAVNIPKYYV
jgi:hypothetical protein